MDKLSISNPVDLVLINGSFQSKIQLLYGGFLTDYAAEFGNFWCFLTMC
jgi:hypothetical protein